MRKKHVCVITFAICLGLSSGPALAQDDAEFDDDFGAAPEPVQSSNDETWDQPAPEQEQKATASEQVREDEDPLLVHNTIAGPTGGIHAVDAGSGKKGSFRLALAFEFFRKDGFLISNASNRHGGTALSMSLTPIDHLELSAQLSANGNENTGSRPTVIQVMGDARLFAKGFFSPLPGLTVGGDFELALLNAVGGLGYQTSAASVGLRGNVTLDMRKLQKPFPLIVRGSMRYFFDNSAKLIRNVERARYNSLSDPAGPDSEYRHLMSNVERFAYRINRTDSFSLGFGLEMPFAPKKEVLVSPLLEWNVAIPVNRQDYNCLVTNVRGDRDSCLAGEGFSSRPSVLSMGVRVQPKVPGLGVMFALDVATSGSSNYVRELAPTAPYQLYFAASYAYEPFAKREPVAPVITQVEVPVEKMRGHIVGQVIDKQGLVAIPHALVHFEGHTLSDIATDDTGRFVSYPFDPGPHTMQIAADGFEPSACSATLPDDASDVQVRCELLAMPSVGTLRGRVLDASGKAVNKAAVELTGPTTITLTSDESGTFNVNDLSTGEYEARVEAEGYLMQVVPLTVRARSESAPVFTLLPKPAKSLVALTTKKIAIKQQVQFVAGSAEIAPQSNALLSEVTDLLLRNRSIARVEVQGHTDNSGTEATNRELSERRAQAVREWLVKAGVEDERLSATGYGSTRPLAPNITQQNRARNRRVELVILETR